jgi:hypothetical protein
MYGGSVQSAESTASKVSRTVRKLWINMVREAGVEPTTFGFGDRRSIQLSYSRATGLSYQLVFPGSIVICEEESRRARPGHGRRA